MIVDDLKLGYQDCRFTDHLPRAGIVFVWIKVEKGDEN